VKIQLSGINKQFGEFKAIDNIGLDIQSGELLALLGPSGSGKTTLLRIIAGLEQADVGSVLFDGIDMVNTPLRERKIGFVFQHYALFKHMTLRENVSFGLRVKSRRFRSSGAAIRARADELLKLVQLAGLEDRYPHQLSGGQRQRVALARALAIDPKVLLLDEPFGALDAKVRKELRQWLRELHQQTGVTTIFVTHDQEEALELADRVVIMQNGKIAQLGSVDQVYEQPASPLVFDFLGDSNIIPAQLHDGAVHVGNAEIGSYTPVANLATLDDGAVDIYVRPSDLRIADAEQTGIDVVVNSIQRTGPIVRAEVSLAHSHSTLRVELPHLHHDVPRFQLGAAVRLRLMQFSVFAPQTITAVREQLGAPILIGRERERLAG
jgi:sulfate transport system ATP-binding protein